MYTCSMLLLTFTASRLHPPAIRAASCSPIGWITRLAEKGYTPQKKLAMSDFKEAQLKKRMTFANKHVDKTAGQWKAELQAVGDIKEFTYYPKD